MERQINYRNGQFSITMFVPCRAPWMWLEPRVKSGELGSAKNDVCCFSSLHLQQDSPVQHGPLREHGDLMEIRSNVAQSNYKKCIAQECTGPTRSLFWWLGHPSEKYEFVNWDDYKFPIYPKCSMYGIFTYIWVICRANVGKYSIHGAYGYGKKKVPNHQPVFLWRSNWVLVSWSESNPWEFLDQLRWGTFGMGVQWDRTNKILVGGWATPLKNMSQLGWWGSQYMGK